MKLQLQSHRWSEPRTWAWTVLAALLVLLLLGALTLDRSRWPSLVGDEATYLMQAESLAWDFDLLYSRRDFDRFVARRGIQPEGLILQSGDEGARIAYGKPFFYAAFLAPFVRLAPVNGPFVANALLLAVACVAATRVLERRAGPLAPLAVAALVFASVAFVYTFWAHADLFLMCLVALAFALIFGAREDAGESRGGWRTAAPWLAAGALLAVVGFSRPMYSTLAVPALAAAPRSLRRRAWPGLLAAALALMLAAGAVHQSLTGSWTGYGASRRGFYSYTGYPEVDFPASGWQDNVRRFGDHAVLEPQEVVQHRKVVASLWAWNTVYFLVGSHVGVIPYFLPLLLCLGGRPRGPAAWTLLAAVAAASVAFLYLRPFNFYGGGGAVANRYFLPLYPALWFLLRRPVRPAWLAVVVVAAGLFLAPSWLRPREFPWAEARYRYVAPAARCCLPYETTQSHLKVSWKEDVRHGELWIRFLDRNLQAVDGGETLKLLPDVPGQLLVGSDRPRAALEVELYGPVGTRLEVAEGRTEALGRRGRRLRVDLPRPRAVHPMWWTWEPLYLYRLTLSAEGSGGRPVRLVLSAAAPPPSL